MNKEEKKKLFNIVDHYLTMFVLACLVISNFIVFGFMSVLLYETESLGNKYMLIMILTSFFNCIIFSYTYLKHIGDKLNDKKR